MSAGRCFALGAAFLVACTRAAEPATPPRPEDCLSRAEAQPLLDFCARNDCDVFRGKMNADLQYVVAAAQRVGEGRTFVHLASDRCIPEWVELLVQFHGPVAELEAVGFVSLPVRDPATSKTMRSGRIATVQLPALAAVENGVSFWGWAP